MIYILKVVLADTLKVSVGIAYDKIILPSELPYSYDYKAFSPKVTFTNLTKILSI